MQGFGFEEAYLPEDRMLWPFRKKRVSLGSPQEARVLELVGAGAGPVPGVPLLQDPSLPHP